MSGEPEGTDPVSYTHLDVYKRQVIEMLNKIAGKTDKEISKLLQQELRKRGVKFLLECRVTSFTEKGLFFEKDGEDVYKRQRPHRWDWMESGGQCL